MDPIRDKEQLELFLKTLTSDDQWDKTDAKQAGYAAMGLTRYKVNFQDTMVKTTDVDEFKEDIIEQTASSGSNINQGQPLQIMGISELEVKIENEAYVVLQNKHKKNIELQEKALTRAMGELKQMRALLTKHSETCEHMLAMSRARIFTFFKHHF